MNRNLVGSTYGRFCIKFPQSRMKGERHRLSPLSLQFFFFLVFVYSKGVQNTCRCKFTKKNSSIYICILGGFCLSCLPLNCHYHQIGFTLKQVVPVSYQKLTLQQIKNSQVVTTFKFYTEYEQIYIILVGQCMKLTLLSASKGSNYYKHVEKT